MNKSMLKKSTKRSLKRVGRKYRRKSLRKSVRKSVRKSGRKYGRKRRMSGGYINYAPLPCDANGATDWNSPSQVGAESCVQYGTDGSEDDPRFSGNKMANMDINQTIKDAVDTALGRKVSELVKQRSAESL